MRARVATLVGLLFSASLALTACGRGGSPEVVNTVGVTPTSTPSSTPTPKDYPQAAFDYFTEIAFGSEFGGSTAVVRKWNQDVTIAVHGDPNDDDLVALKDVVEDLNTLIGTVEVTVGGPSANVNMYFMPEEQFAEIQPAYIPVNMGFFYIWWDADGGFTDAEILISTTGVTQEEREHLIREELTQAMGLMRDSYTYEDSMFYQGWTATPAYSAMDELVIEMLYLPEVESGMDVDEVIAAIRGR